MNARQRVAATMALAEPDRVPVMCQLSIGHYFLNSGIPALDLWFNSESFAEALVRLQQRYGFDGILVNLPGRDPDWRKDVLEIDEGGEQTTIRWRNGAYTQIPANDNPHYYQASGSRYFPRFADVDPEALFYVEPWDITEVTYPFTWGFEPEPRPFEDFFPPYQLNTLHSVLKRTQGTVSVHGEVFSPWSQFLELLNYENALLAVHDDPEKTRQCLDRLTQGAAFLGVRQAELGADAILISSAFAGGGFISREQYREFVLPFERRLIAGIRDRTTVPIYTHTCGRIGDRLDLMLETGTDGIDTLDPPPIGNVELAEAKTVLTGRAFIKGNLDPVNTLLNGSVESIRREVMERLHVAKPGGGYVLSSACSVAPETPPENLVLLREITESEGKY
jgi:hypothetical protein